MIRTFSCGLFFPKIINLPEKGNEFKVLKYYLKVFLECNSSPLFCRKSLLRNAQITYCKWKENLVNV